MKRNIKVSRQQQPKRALSRPFNGCPAFLGTDSAATPPARTAWGRYKLLGKKADTSGCAKVYASDAHFGYEEIIPKNRNLS